MHCQSKRKALIDLSNISSDDETTITNTKRTSIVDMLPTKTDKENTIPTQLLGDRFQNVHLLLSWYKFDLNNSIIVVHNLINRINFLQLVLGVSVNDVPCYIF